MAKIYVSSTYLDLQEFREKILYHLQRLQQSVVAMEYYLADDRRPAEKCIADVQACDIYVGIFAWRYGTIPKENNPEQLSITEMEYRAASDKGIPCLIFLHDGKSPWLPDLVDDDKTRIKALRQRLAEAHTVQWFTNADELASRVGASLYNLLIGQGEHAPTGVTPFALDRYYAALRKRYSILALEGLTPPQREEYLRIQLRQVFVEPNLRANPPPIELPKEVWERLARTRDLHPDDLPSDITLDDVRRAREAYTQQPSRRAFDVLTDPSQRHLVILGDPGSGKTTLARYLLLSLIEPTGDETLRRAFAGYVPLLIELRTYVGLCTEKRCDTFLDYLDYLGRTEGWALTRDALDHHLRHDGRAVVIFDGLDEIFDPELRERVTHQIVGFGNAYPKARIIVTSRVIGYRRKILTDAGFAHFTLQDLDEPQVETFVTRWYDLALSERPDEARERRARVLAAFRDLPSIRLLAGNPMLLTIMAIIGKHQELPRERWKLYDHAASVLIEHWDVNKHLRDARLDADFIGEEEKKELLRRLALKMQGWAPTTRPSDYPTTLGNYIHRDDLQAVFEAFLRERFQLFADRAVTIARAMIEQFRERNFILCLYGANLYGFVHRAFLEFFYASALVRQFEKTRELTLDQLKHAVYGKHWQDQSWHEVLRLICGMLDPRWAGEIITYLVEEVNRDWQSRERPGESSLPWHLALALFCLSEVQNPGAIPDAADHVVDAVFTLFEYEMAEWRGEEHYRLMKEQVRPAIAALSRSFAKLRERAREDAKERENRLEKRLARFRAGNYAHGYADLFGEWVGQIGGGDANVHAILLHYLKQDWEYRVLVPYALAVGWHADAQTLPILRDRARNDAHAWVRAVAVEALAAHYRDDAQTLPLVRDRAINDAHEGVRRTAVEALIAHYRADAQTLPILREWAVSAEHSDVRAAAVHALIEHYRADAQTLPILRDRASNDAEWRVRAAAVAALIEHYRADAQTLPILREWAVSAEHSDVRAAAVHALAAHYRDDAQTLPLVRDRARNDAHAWVRAVAVRALIEHYRDDAQTLPLVRDRAINDAEWRVRAAAVESLIEHYRADAQTLPILRDRAINDAEWRVRAAAVESLAEHYRADAQTLPILRDRAINDAEWWVRAAAVESLAEHYRADAQTLPILREWAVSAEHSDVRAAAVEALAEHYRADAQTLPILRDRAINDAEWRVRAAAVEALAEHFRADAQTLPLLRDRASNDAHAWVRAAAVRALAAHYRDDTQTLPLVRDRASNDAEWQVRAAAVHALAAHFRDDAQTLPILRDRASNDESPKPDEEKLEWEEYVREVAIEALARYWGEKAETLALLRERAQNDPTPWLRERAKELLRRVGQD